MNHRVFLHFVKATTGVVRELSEFSMTLAHLPPISVMYEFVVPITTLLTYFDPQIQDHVRTKVISTTMRVCINLLEV